MFQSFQCYYLREDLFILRIRQVVPPTPRPPGNSLNVQTVLKMKLPKKQIQGDIGVF